MTAFETTGARFDLARVVQRTFEVIGKNLVTFGIAAVLLAGVPAFISAWGQGDLLATQYAGTNAWAISGVGWVLSLIGAYILQAAIVFATVNTLNGRTVSLGAALQVGVQNALPMLALAIIVSVCVFLGMILLIVPGLILAVLWSVAAPARVAEKRTIFGSLQRSRDLTRGYRWEIFGLMVIYFIVSAVIGIAIGGLGAATGGSFLDGSGVLAINLIVLPLTSIVQGVIAAAGVAAIYYELRTAKEGTGAEELAAIFD